jgi:hypothetical protein
VKSKKVIGMKVIAMGLALLLLTSCGARGANDIDSSDGKPPVQEDPYKEREISARILNFRTQDREPLDSEARLLQNHAEFQTYLEDYAIVENPSFIGNAELDTLKDIDDKFFEDKAIAVAVSVEHSGSNQFVGKRAFKKGAGLFLEVERKQPSIGTTDIATRHAVFILNQAEIQDVESVELSGVVSP